MWRPDPLALPPRFSASARFGAPVGGSSLTALHVNDNSPKVPLVAASPRLLTVCRTVFATQRDIIHTTALLGATVNLFVFVSLLSFSFIIKFERLKIRVHPL